jgi:UDP-glucose 4-epimerase
MSKLFDLSPGKRVLVTGGAGFIGSHVCEVLLSQGLIPVVIDNISTGHWSNLAFDTEGKIERIESDLLNPEVLPGCIADVDAAIHLAAQVSPPLSIERPLFSMEQNISSFVYLLETIREEKPDIPLVYASSAAIYGDQDGNPCDESATVSSPQPTSHYGLEKWNLEHYAALYRRLYQLNLTGLRFFNVYGQRQDPSSQYSGVISKFMDAASTHKSITIFGDGQQTRDFIYVRDVVHAILHGLSIGYGNVFNVATGTSISLIKLYQTIETLHGISLNVHHAPARLGDIRYSLACNTNGMQAGILPESFTALSEGLASMLPKQQMLTHSL